MTDARPEPGMFDLTGRVCVVTGALGLIGRELSRSLAAAGGSVVVCDLEHEACVDHAGMIGPTAMGWGADVTEPETIEALRDAVLERHGQIDVLVTSAAIDDRFAPGASPREACVEEYSLERWRRALDVNVTGTFLSCQILGTAMAERRAGGSIITIASTYGLVAPDQRLYRRPDGTQPFYKSPAYPTTKAAVLGLTRHLAAYWGAAGVRVNALSPGGVENGQAEYFVQSYASRTPLGRMAVPRDYAGAVVFLASNASAYMTGANLVVDGGWTAW